MTATREIIAWPYAIYSGDVGLNLVTQNRSPGSSLSGFTQVIGGGGQRWAFTMDANTLRPELVPVYRATLAKADGRLGLFRIPVRDRYAPKPGPDGLPGANRVLHSSGAAFSTGAGYIIRGPDIRATVGQGETSFAADELTRTYLGPGMYFGLGEDLHLCTHHKDGEVHFKPAARRNHSSRLISLRPSLIARLEDDTTGALALDMGFWGAPRISMIEHVLP
jgi:hypothetical protein